MRNDIDEIIIDTCSNIAVVSASCLKKESQDPEQQVPPTIKAIEQTMSELSAKGIRGSAVLAALFSILGAYCNKTAEIVSTPVATTASVN